jgi:hypothetical protein
LDTEVHKKAFFNSLKKHPLLADPIIMKLTILLCGWVIILQGVPAHREEAKAIAKQDSQRMG